MPSRKSPYKGSDVLTQQAKKGGYPARSVFKLEEIDRRARLLRPGLHVLDLGAAPGSWSIYVAQKITSKGMLVAVDSRPLKITLPSPHLFIPGNVFELSRELLLPFAPYDLVLSDMAPSTTGSHLADQARSVELFLQALLFSDEFLRVGGSFVGKLLMGGDFPQARTAIRERFEHEKIFRPEGTRRVSSEIFLVGFKRR
ncbi:SAM-dependent methyltransferase [Pajaroellobacter abortibovis]|uniref:Ribosomal RNA large subunit methyltransferase E n=1 Tax=Pajaroellobacter abortibovis TaxID=1882918 RepID=A0A1L6MVP5_9BACT|nr:RlmE family RNA methyltransferase [Pajaroellobacter abortibovis]APR99581.1 50S rRNA methyltransferase [Pajaroellobacter abortibovis]